MRTYGDEDVSSKTSLQMDLIFFSSSPVWAACRNRRTYLWWLLSFWKLIGLSFFCFFRFLLKLGVRWPVWSKHVTCDMLQGIFEAKQKQSCLKQEVKGGMENWNPRFQQLNRVKLSCKRREFNGGRVPHLSALPAGWRNASKRSDSIVIRFCKLHDSQDSFLNRKVTKHSLEQKYCVLGIQRVLETPTSPSPRLAWFLVGPAPKTKWNSIQMR